jgi:hypothetical protein
MNIACKLCPYTTCEATLHRIQAPLSYYLWSSNAVAMAFFTSINIMEIMIYSFRPQISVHLAQVFVYKRVYFSLFDTLLSIKNCFSLITLKSRPIVFSRFSTFT